MLETEIKIEGLQELSKKLNNLSYDISKRGTMYAVRKGAQHMADKVKRNVARLDDPDTFTNIERNVVVRFNSKEFKRNGSIGYRVGILGGARSQREQRRNRWTRISLKLSQLGEFEGSKLGAYANPGGDTFYWRFLEFGTRFISPKPFMSPVIYGEKGATLRIVVLKLKKRIDNAIRKSQIAQNRNKRAGGE